MDLFIAVVVALVCAYEARFYLHMLQLESYQLDGYLRYLKRNGSRMADSTIVIGAGALILHYLLSLLGWLIFKKADLFVGRLITLAAFAALAWALDQRLHKQKQKKPMAFTPRMKRLYACLAVICLAGSLILWALGVPPYPLFIAVPYLALAAGYLMQPVENRINEGFKKQARAILKQRDDLIKIGITGSYGKTSTKFILAAILSERFRVLATPASFNTPMGLTRVIREQLDNTHQIFLAEMGARHVGDIRELVDLVHPTIGLITSVGPQHLETFHDIEIVANTKFELIEGVTEANGMAFFSMDNGWVSKLYDRATCKKFAAGLQGTNLDMRADDITVGPSGSQFILRNAFGETVKCTTRLLGRHNIQNIVLAACCAEKLGMSMPEIARGIARIKPVEHRLQLIPSLNGTTIIDDAFNSNPSGAKAAMEVLAGFPGRHIVITPGMVEQGAGEAEINREFGRQMAAAANVAILVGKKRSEPIRAGLIEAGMREDSIHVAASLEEATGILARVSAPGDVVLFENDLPDNYNEL